MYGSKMPLNQVAAISVPEPRTISVQVWDKANISAVDKAIREANLGLNPIVDGTLIRLPIPTLTAERRQEFAKLAHKYAEQSRVSVRNVRREGMEHLKRLEKGGEMSKDDHHKASADVQELTDKLVKEIDATLEAKEAEIHKVWRSSWTATGAGRGRAACRARLVTAQVWRQCGARCARLPIWRFPT